MPVDPNNKARAYNDTGIASGTSVLASNVTPSESPVVFEITTAVNASARLDLIEWDGTTEFNHTLNGGSNVGATTLHTEAVPVNENSEYNVQFGSDVNVNVLLIDERAMVGEN